jgi:hypothetical protein
MTPRSTAFFALTVAIVAALGSLSLSYGLVYPSGAHHSKVPIALSILAGALTAAVAGWLSARAHRHAALDSERFVALLAGVISAFFLFVIVFGFAIPALILGPHD